PAAARRRGGCARRASPAAGRSFGCAHARGRVLHLAPRNPQAPPAPDLVSPMRILGSSVPLALIAATASAQCFEPVFGVQLATATALTGDVQLPGVPLGFAFPLGGTTYTDVHVCDKGYVYLS